MIGKRLGQYEIIEEIGRGGMAVVYKAWQPALERHVALKVLPDYFRHDPEFLARFQREARAAAGLSHPNIIAIHDVGEQDGVHYIAMEWVDGGSLGTRLTAGALSLEQTQRVLAQTADALDCAHRHGLIHRDIKPGNILFTSDGRVKVADFGIAHAAGGTQLTRSGVILGTPEYMAPEQAQGMPVDHRLDLYALGVVLYQMLTGRVPFRGTTPHAALHAVIYDSPPPPRALNPELPAAVETVVLKALAKQPQDRFQTGASMVEAFQRARSGLSMPIPPSSEPPAQPTPAPWLRPRYLALAIAGIAVLLVGTVAFLLVPPGGERAAAATASAQAATTRGAQTTGPPSASPAILLATRTPTPSASFTAMRPTDPPGPTATHTLAPAGSPEPTVAPPTATRTPRPTETPEPTLPLPTPTASGGGNRVGFVSDRTGNDEIFVVHVDGSGLTQLTDNPAADWGPDWSQDGRRIAFASERAGNWEIYTMDAGGGGVTRMTDHPDYDSTPSWSPNGRRIAFMTDRDGNLEIYALDVTSRAVTRLTNDPGVDALPAWSPAGGLIAFQSGRSGNDEILVMNPDGSGVRNLTNDPGPDWGPAWSPDGRRIAFASERDDNWEIYVMNADGSGQTRLTNNAAIDQDPSWSSDGNRITFMSFRDGNSDIYVMNADGSGQTRLTGNPTRDESPSWARP
jgi:Tol biopolymer transport system component/tRNA A-37 threonylcarbamoyl transferase component Bud32